jgi:hypothetical protein
MLKGKNIFTNGCSFTSGPDSWPYRLRDKTGCNIINFGLGGAGNKYIHDTSIRELMTRKYDLALIMWSGTPRLDIKVDDISMFAAAGANTSNNQISHHKWKEKVIHPVDEADYIEPNWVFLTTEYDYGLLPKMYGQIRKVKNLDIYDEQTYIYQISLEAVLKNLNIPYLFMHFKGRKFSPALDPANVLKYDNLYDVAVRTNNLADDGYHPNRAAQDQWADIIIENLTGKIK